ncbi:hypothetical protein J7K74_03850 [Candidatus Woesearchaeota archaeon]|nr:hypothetical protein [Candidatus Woesearchaeota archaeon]
MGPMEKVIWDKFLLTTPLKFIKIEYDVRVGPGYVPKEKYPEYIIRMAKALTQLRIDAVGHQKERIWIFEVKPRAGRSALGQLESYRYWYIKDYKPTKPVQLAVVAYYIDPNLEPIFEHRGIYVFLVEGKKYGSSHTKPFIYKPGIYTL